MGIGRLNKGQIISGRSAILLLGFMFFNCYGLRVAETPNSRIDLRLFEDGGNVWQTLEVTSIVLALVIAVTVGTAVRRLIGRSWEAPISPGAMVFVLGALAACLILIRIVFPPDLGSEAEGFTFEVTLKAGIFLALAAACGIAYGGGRAMQEEGASLADLLPLQRQDKR